MQDTDRDDMEADALQMAAVPKEDRLVALRRAGQLLSALDEQIVRTEKKLAELKTQRWELATKTIPDLMDEVGVDRIGIPGDNVDLVAEPHYKAVLPEENSEEAALWLNQHHHGDIMRTVVSVDFSPGEHEHAENVLTLIRSYFRGRNIEQREPNVKNTVHWRTLTSFVKEQVEAGVAIPLPLFGATVGRMAKLVKRKDRR